MRKQFLFKQDAEAKAKKYNKKLTYVISWYEGKKYCFKKFIRRSFAMSLVHEMLENKQMVDIHYEVL